MKMNTKTCKYIDKDKILPALERRKREHIDSCCDTSGIDRRLELLQLVDEVQFIIDAIEDGMYDWNQGSE